MRGFVRSGGFTLVELLVVIGIISLLSVIGATIFRNSVALARDARRKLDIEAISKAYEINHSLARIDGYGVVNDGDFASGTVPTPPEGGLYSGLLTGPATAYRVCAALEANPSRSCFEPANDCFCKSSSVGEYDAAAAYRASYSIIPDSGCEIVPSAMYLAEYWSDWGTGSSPTFPTITPTLSRNEPILKYWWGAGDPDYDGGVDGLPGSPDLSISQDHFAAKWSKTEYFTGGNYRFQVLTDDGVRLYVDGAIAIDEWNDQ